MSEKRDYYDVLGVEKSASASDLKNAFRRLARKYHPDRSTEEDAEDRFKEIQEAYACSRTTKSGLSTTGLGTVDLKVPFGGFGGGGFNINLEDILGGFLFLVFWRWLSSTLHRRGSDILIRHSISSEMSTSVRSKRSKLTPEPCTTCDGTGRRMAS